MERAKWTDDVLDQRFAAMDEKFELAFSDLRLLRQEMQAGFAALREEMQAGFAALRQDMKALRAELLNQMAVDRAELVNQMALDRAEVVALHRQINRMLTTALVAVIGLLGVLVAKL